MFALINIFAVCLCFCKNYTVCKNNFLNYSLDFHAYSILCELTPPSGRLGLTTDVGLAVAHFPFFRWDGKVTHTDPGLNEWVHMPIQQST
jgi:hypothetical protein